MTDNSAKRKNFCSDIYETGVSQEKQKIIGLLQKHFGLMHTSGDIHIHDLEGFGKVNNCCTPDWKCILFFQHYQSESDAGIIGEIFNTLEIHISLLGNSQSGGIGFGNFDLEISRTLQHLDIAYTSDNQKILCDHIRLFLYWINHSYTRYCREPYYVTLNIGLGTDPWSRSVSHSLLQCFRSMSMSETRPNIVFKVKADVNLYESDPNHDLLQEALQCTAKRMIPTYLIMDSAVNSSCEAEKLNIMGCRTRVYSNINGEEGTIGRGNIGCISINLPRLALKAGTEEAFSESLAQVVKDCFSIFEIRRELFLKHQCEFMKMIDISKMWHDAETAEDILKTGTYSIGFIGLSETVQILYTALFYQNDASYQKALQIVRFLRKLVDAETTKSGYNCSLLATPAEMLSGRFCRLDSQQFPHAVQEKGYYTNSFHVDVDSHLPILDKIQIEAPFHAYCSGGCISYIELREAPLENVLGLLDILLFAREQGISYMGFNFPLDICKECGQEGTFDRCPTCGSDAIQRIRRVSGYLESLDRFTPGKKMEVRHRRKNDY